MDWNSISDTAIIQEIGKRLREYRLARRLTQQQLAEKAGVSLFTVTKIEKGKPVSLSMFLAIMRVLRLLNNFELLLPEQQISPVEIMKLKGKKPQRIRHKK